MDYQFRSALNGFHRGDVVACLQNQAEQHRSELLKQQTELQRLREENAQLKENSDRLQAENDQLQAAREQLQAVPNRVGAETSAPSEPSPQVSAMPMQQQELDAYRRAEAAERVASQRAAQLEHEAAERVAAMQQTMESLLRAAAGKANQADAAVKDLTAAASGSLNAIGRQLSDMETFLDETAKSLRKLRK
ncbi:MAG: hypothetical protein VB055_10780 [Oscillospiraceae bacterium]|nr:hypothetical protein [Oscillospiraceae bacterium]